MKALLAGLLAFSLSAGLAAADTRAADAAASGDRDAVLAAIMDHADVNARQPDGTSALMWAAYHRDAEMARALLRVQADPNVRNDYGASALMEAAAYGDADMIRLLLAAGADVESKNPEGQTALMAVARTGRVDAARALLEAGADPDAVESWGGQTALMWAAAQHHPDMIDLLIEAGADPNARGAVREWGRRVTAEPRPKDMHGGGLTPLLYAAREGCAECVRRLVAGGADPDRHERDRGTPLVIALMSMQYDTAVALIESGADIDKWDLYGHSPLYVAVDMNTTPAGGRPDIPATERHTPLDVARLLLDRGANPNLQLKTRPPYRNVIQDRGGDNLLSTGATPLLRAAKAGDNAAVRLLLADERTLIDLPTATGVTPFLTAAGMGHGVNPTRGRYKTEADGVETLNLLAEAGADIHAVDQNGRNAVHAAVEKGWADVIVTLHGLGVDLNAEDAFGATPVGMARGEATRRERFRAPPEPQPEIAALLERLLSGETAALPAPVREAARGG